jgi:general secretion pathway protein D
LVKKFDIKLDDPSAQSSIHVRPLDYADAKKLATTLSTLASDSSRTNTNRRSPVKPLAGLAKGNDSSVATLANIGEGVKITADESSNSLLITGNRNAYDALNTIIRKLDVRRSQVFVEADILDLTSGNDFRFKTSIFGGFAGPFGKGSAGLTGWQAAAAEPLILGDILASSATGAEAQLAAARSVAGAFSDNLRIGLLAGQSIEVPGLGKIKPSALIDILKGDNNTKVLSSPHILTSNNEEATVSVGRKIFFQSSEVNATTGASIPKLEKEDVDLTLKIKPNISHSEDVTLAIELDSNTLEATAIGAPPRIGKRKTKQMVTVKNHTTVVISGLKINTEAEAHKKVPLLGDIPIIGWLFRETSKLEEESSMAIFLTPHIVHGAADLSEIYHQKIKERDNLLKNIYGDGYDKSRFYKQLPTAEAGDYKPTAFDRAEDERRVKSREDMFKAMGYDNADQGVGALEPVGEAAENGDDDNTMTVPMPIDDGGSAPSEAPSEPSSDEG